MNSENTKPQTLISVALHVLARLVDGFIFVLKRKATIAPALVATLAILGGLGPALANDTSSHGGISGSATDVEEVVAAINKNARRAARLIGRRSEPVSISCDPRFIVCTCSDVFDCAWLGWYCGKLGGVRGFDDECYLPSSVPGTPKVLLKAQILMKNRELNPRRLVD